MSPNIIRRSLLSMVFILLPGFSPGTAAASADGEPVPGSAQRIGLWPTGLAPGDKPLAQAPRVIERSADWSFPSDHSTASFAIAAAFLLHGFRGRGSALLVAALVVGLSRVYVGTHYVTDVLGGAATGIAAAILVCLLYREGTRADRMVTGIL